MHHMGAGVDARDVMRLHEIKKRAQKTRLMHKRQLRPGRGAVCRIAGVA